MLEIHERAEPLKDARPDPDFDRVKREQTEGRDEDCAAIQKNDEETPRGATVAAQEREQYCKPRQMHDHRNADDECGQDQLVSEGHDRAHAGPIGSSFLA